MMALLRNLWSAICRSWRTTSAKLPVWNGAVCDKQIVPAFVHKGVQYFTFADLADMPAARMVWALRFFAENEMRATFDFMAAHTQRVDQAIQSKNWREVDRLNNDLKERLNWYFAPSTVLKCAGLVFFSRQENPNVYVESYAREKVEGWVKDGLQDFFLEAPFSSLYPLMPASDTDLHVYWRGMAKLEMAQHIQLYKSLSSDSSTALSSSQLLYQMQVLKDMVALVN